MPRRSAEASTSAACAASVLGTPKCRKTRVLNSRNASMGNILASTLAMPLLCHPCFATQSRLRGQNLPSRFHAKGYQQQAQGKSQRSHGHGNSERAAVLNTRANQKRNCGATETGERS